MSRLLVPCASLVALAAALLLGPPSQAAPDSRGYRPISTVPAACTIDELPLPTDYVKGLVEGGDPTGRHLFGWVETGFPFFQDQVVWDTVDGTVEIVDLGYVNRQLLTDAAPDGTLVGIGQSEGQPGEAFVVQPDGSHVVLDPGASFQAEAWAIDNDGTVAGFLRDTGSVPAIWPRVDRAPKLLLPGPDDDTQPSGIAQGRVFGIVYDFPTSAYVWSGRRMTPKELPTVDPAAFVRTGEATGKYAVGREENFDEDHFAVLRWNLKKRTVEAYEISMSTDSINKHGVIGGGDGARPLLVDGDELQVLPNLAPGRDSRVTHVANDGDAYGYGVDASGTLTPVAWSCG